MYTHPRAAELVYIFAFLSVANSSELKKEDNL